MKWFIIFMVLLAGCRTVSISIPRPAEQLTGTIFYKSAAAYNYQQRDSLAVQWVLNGNVPSFLTSFVPVDIFYFDSTRDKKIKATIYVSQDYISVGTDKDWARVPLTPMASSIIAEHFDCFLPTKKIVDAVYKAAKVKLEPVPLYAFRDSTPVMYHHHLIIEGQRKLRSGLIAGIKKDVVNSSKPGRVAIYGWHRLNGIPIQPLYMGHVDWYVDYSHGARLVYKKMKVDGRWMDYKEVLNDAVLRNLICEGDCGM